MEDHLQTEAPDLAPDSSQWMTTDAHLWIVNEVVDEVSHLRVILIPEVTPEVTLEATLEVILEESHPHSSPNIKATVITTMMAMVRLCHLIEMILAHRSEAGLCLQTTNIRCVMLCRLPGQIAQTTMGRPLLLDHLHLRAVDLLLIGHIQIKPPLYPRTTPPCSRLDGMTSPIEDR